MLGLLFIVTNANAIYLFSIKEDLNSINNKQTKNSQTKQDNNMFNDPAVYNNNAIVYVNNDI